VRRAFTGAGNAPAYSYDPYGNALQTTAPVTDFGYAGMFYNADSGLYLTQYRAYDPRAGRWLSRDPIGEASDPAGNLYAYVQGNPVSYVDPDGKQAWLEFLGGRLPPIVEAFIRQGAKIPDEALNLPRETIPNQTGKAAASDVPSWCQGARPMIRESGADFAKRLMNEKYGEGKWGSSRQQKGEFSKIKKWGDRNFRIPDDWLKTYKPPAI
jgi:RHS repeat-associated protein